jgi:hypothetical protein
MKYVFDSDVFINMFKYYYPKRFPSFWKRFHEYIDDGLICSVREVKNEIKNNDDELAMWTNKNSSIFYIPKNAELLFITEMFKVKNGHFQQVISKRSQFKGAPVADPFVIAKAKVESLCVVTAEKYKENSAKIPNICEHFKIDCTDLEGFLEREDWIF